MIYAAEPDNRYLRCDNVILLVIYYLFGGPVTVVIMQITCFGFTKYSFNEDVRLIYIKKVLEKRVYDVLVCLICACTLNFVKRETY